MGKGSVGPGAWLHVPLCGHVLGGTRQGHTRHALQTLAVPLDDSNAQEDRFWSLGWLPCKGRRKFIGVGNNLEAMDAAAGS